MARDANWRRERSETIHPGERSRFSPTRRAVAFALAVALPIVVAVLMIPFRADHGRAAVLVLVLPVLVVAVLGGVAPAVVGAVASVVAYDVFLVEPYYSLAIDDSDEVVAAVTLLVVGAVVGVLSGRLIRLGVSESTRRQELRHLIGFIRANSERRAEADLTADACAHIAGVLGLTSCVWEAGGRRATGPVLLMDGNLMGLTRDLKPDRAVLPDHLDIPVWSGDEQLGRFVLTSTAGRVVSFEERVIAASIAELYGQAISPRH